MDHFTGQQYLKIDIANNYGLDKKDWSERIQWFDDNESRLPELVKQADEPALFYAGIKAWNDVKANKPIGYPISLDATSSGLQILAALTGDRKAASLCNVVDTGHREDAYTNVYNFMLEEIGDTSKISRDHAKDAIMTSLYGSTAVPKEIFGEGELLDVFYDTMHNVAPGAWELNQAFLSMWDPEALSNDWVLPDNFHVHVKVMNQVKETVHFLNEPFDVFYNVNRPIEEGRSLGANVTHSLDGMIVREIGRRCDYNPKQILKVRRMIDGQPTSWDNQTLSDNDNLVATLWDRYNKSGYLSARILDHLKPNNLGHVDVEVIRDLIDSFPQKPFKVLSVHDRFCCLPTYGNDLRKQYNIQLRDIAKSNLLSFIISQIVGREIEVCKLDPNLWKDIEETNYALS